MEVQVKVINKSNNQLPEYKHPGDSGMDIRAYIESPIILESGKIKKIPTGIYVEIPSNDYEIQVRSRSGLALKNGVMVLNSPGTIDAGYKDEICIILANFGDSDFIVSPGDRIAQLVLARVEKIKFIETDRIDTANNNRNGGFGHTGVN